VEATVITHPQPPPQLEAAAMPTRFSPRRLARKSLPALAALAAIVLIVLLAPGLGDVRELLAGASPWWLAAGVALELASCVAYVLMFRPVFCNRMQKRLSAEIGFSELAMGSIVPASGAGGLALGAWILRRRGMAGERIARRSVAFFLIKSSVNFVAVAVLGVVMATGLVGPDLSLALTALPAALSIALIAAVIVVPRFGPGSTPPPGAGRIRRGVSAARRWLVRGTAEAIELVRSRDVTLIGGAIGYWAFDNAVLWATFHAVGDVPPLTVVLMAYLIGQLGGLLPLPGGIGGIDGGLFGTFVVYGAPVAAAAAAVVAYRLILFWVPLVTGLPAFGLLTRRLRRDAYAAGVS
jgi:uncharacterized membrane protein YbhN (UPF0104 family)